MHPRRGKLNALDRVFDVARSHKHQVGELVDHHEQVRVGLQLSLAGAAGSTIEPWRTASLKSSMCLKPKLARSS